MLISLLNLIHIINFVFFICFWNGLESEYDSSGCWDDADGDVNIAIECAIDDFKQTLSKEYPYGLKNIPNEPIIYRLITAKNIEDINKNNLGKSWFANKNQPKEHHEFFDMLLHIKQNKRDLNHKIFLIEAKTDLRNIDIKRTLWQRSTQFYENEIVVIDDSKLKNINIQEWI